MKPITSFNAAVAQVATHPVQLLKVEARGGDSAAATGLFLQIHDSSVTPAVAAVPKKAWPISTSGEFYKEFKNGEFNLTAGCFVGVSTTEATYTASSGNDKFAMLSVELSDPEQQAQSSAGDLTTAVTGLQVWSEAAGAAGAKRLLRLEVDGTNLTAATTQYIMLFGTDTVNPGDSPMMQFTIAAGAVKTGAAALVFGELGREISNTNKGCTVKISSTTDTYTAASGTARIKAEYKS